MMNTKVNNPQGMLQELIRHYEFEADKLYKLNPLNQNDVNQIVAAYNNTFLTNAYTISLRKPVKHVKS